MIVEILKEVATLQNIKDATSKYVLLLVHKAEVQRTQNSAHNDIKEANDFDVVR